MVLNENFDFEMQSLYSKWKDFELGVQNSEVNLETFEKKSVENSKFRLENSEFDLQNLYNLEQLLTKFLSVQTFISFLSMINAGFVESSLSEFLIYRLWYIPLALI